TYGPLELTRMRANAIVKAGVAHVPEGRRIFPNLTVMDNLQLGAHTRRDREHIKGDLDDCFSIFPRLKERLNQAGGTLSGGEQQMLAMGRGLMSRPELLLLDEPSMGLSPILVEEIFRIIQEINQQGTSILLVEQNAHMALSVASRGYVLETGRIVLEGSAAELRENAQVRAAYLGG
ncbi:MAG TPA: ABC transporter ATP-binding protein, partial [Anaerolineae bacterium]|nr:ABC transporter ATP-binding protein [Anaerolineae bacterium]